MRLPPAGGCQCGALRCEIARASDAVHTCQCTDRQRLTGIAFALPLLVEEDAFRLARPEPRPFQRIADSGRTPTRWTCAECGAWACSGPKPGSLRPPGALRKGRAGALDDTSWLRPTLHFWTRSAQPWVVLPPGGRSFETQPTDFGWMRPPSAP